MGQQGVWGWCPEEKKWVKLRVDDDGSFHVVGYIDNLDDIGDVDVAAPTDLYIVYWNATNSKWEARAFSDWTTAAHKDRHDPQDGADPLDTAIPVKVAAANAIGSSHSLARADHVHEREHARYIDAEAVTAMGAKADDNPLHHDRADEWGATEHTAVGNNAPHHAKYTNDEAVAAIEATADMIARLAKQGNWFNIGTASGWTEVTVNSGNVIPTPCFLDIYSGSTANSSALAHCRPGFLQGASNEFMRIDWDKDLRIIFNLCLSCNTATGISRMQLKQVNTIGALAAKGIGIRVDNLDLVGESYGTELGEVALTTLTADIAHQIEIVLSAGASIKWYVDGVLVGTQSTAAKIPSGVSAAYGYLVGSSINGATAACQDSLFSILKIWQER